MSSNANDGMETVKSVKGKDVDKIARYGWIVKDEPGEMLFINKKSIHIDPDYQRDAIASKVLEMASGWSWIACGVISVGKRDGKYWAIDGQHRVLAAMKRSDIKDLPCIVFQTKGQRGEARGFFMANNLRKAMKSVDKYRALIVAGDENALYVQGVLNGLGLCVNGAGTLAVNELKCIALVLHLAEIDKREFEKTISFAAELCKGKMGIQDRLLSGLSFLNTHCGDGLDDRRLSSRLMEAGPGRLLEGAAKACAYFSKGGSAVYAQGLLDTINKGLKNRYELESMKE